MQFAQPLLGLLALLAVPAILLMYLLKQKYKEKQVPSLYLWEKVLTLTKAQEPWQKLRKNLLLFLQIAAALLLALALSGPYLMGKMQGRDYILALDCSLSMQATDVEKSRFAAAKEDLIDLVENAAPGAQFSLVMLTDTPTLAVSGGEKDVVLRMAENASPTAGGVNWEEAKSLLSAEQEALGGEIVVYTDGYGNLGTLAATEQVYAGEGENTAVTLLSHTAQEDGLYVMARLHHYGTSDQEKTVTLYADGAAFDTKTVTAAAGADTDVVFRGVPAETKTLEVRISPDDVLAADNSRFAGLAAAEQQKVLLVSQGNLFLEKALSLSDRVELYQTDSPQENLSGYSLYVFDGGLPENMPTDGHWLLIDPPSGNGVVEVGTERNFTEDVHGVSGSGLENSGNISFALAKGTPFSASWGTAFLQAEGQNLGLYGETNGRKVAALGFDLHDSDFPLQTQFPILLYRLLEWYFPANGSGVSQVTAGEQVSLSLLPTTETAAVVTAAGKEVSIAPPFPPRTLTETAEPGLYTLRETDASNNVTETPFGVNAKTEGESDLSLRGEKAEQTKSTTKEIQGSRSILKWVLLLLLAVLLIEWRVNCREH